MTHLIKPSNAIEQKEFFPEVKKEDVNLPPEVQELISRVAKAAGILADAMANIIAIPNNNVDLHTKCVDAIQAFIEESDSLMLCKIATKETNIPPDTLLKIQNLQGIAKEAFVYLIDKGHLEFIGAGTEGSAYKLCTSNTEGNSRDFVVLKKSHEIGDGRIRNEFNMQELAHIVSSSVHGVKVPRPYMNFSKNGDHYMVMEYVHGKTLYTLQLEQVANKIVLERILLKLSDRNIDESIKIQVLKELGEFYTKNGNSSGGNIPISTPLYGFFERYTKDSPILFEIDIIAEEKLMQLLQIAYQIEAIEGDPLKKVLDPQFGVEVLELATKLYRENEKKFPLFVDKEAISVSRSLRSFFDSIHNRGLHHRDLHPRNLMFGFDGNIYVIDFGYAKVDLTDPYSERGGGERIDDYNLVNYIASQRPSQNTIASDLLGPKLAKQQISLEKFDFVGLCDLTGISPADLKLAVSLQNFSFKSSFLLRQFAFLVNKKAGVSWEIFLQPKGDSVRLSAYAESRWTFALALLSNDDFHEFSVGLEKFISTLSPTAQKRAKSLIKRLSICAKIARGENINWAV